MKYQDYKMIEGLFRDQPSKKDKNSDVETFFKVYKAIKKFEEKEKVAKKEEKKDDKPKGKWSEMSTIQKVTVLTALVPILFTIEFLFPVLVIMKILGVH